ncbi:MAG: TrmB family transcriptional regulator [Fimbriimonas sp.]
MSHADAARVLSGLGFTGLEAEIYAFLVRESPATGYRIAAGINKPVANTYKAIQTLQAKGAIEVEEGESRQCRAVPSDELLDRLGREFESKRTQAKDLLSRLGQPVGDERVYQIRARTQLFARVREMLASATQVVLLCAPKTLVAEFAESMAAAAARGIQIQAKTDADLAIPRVESFVATRPDDLVHDGGYLRLVVDGEGFLTAHLDGDVVTALSTRNPAFALPAHEGLAAEIALLAISERIEDGAGPKRLAKALGTAPTAAATPGYWRE